MSEYDTFEFLGTKFNREESQKLLEQAGYSNFKLEWGRGRGGFSELKLCCDHPEGERMFAEYAWKKERDHMLKDLLLRGIESSKELPEGS
jgi:hypothetical protein